VIICSVGGCIGSYAVPAIHGALGDDFMAIKERRYGWLYISTIHLFKAKL